MNTSMTSQAWTTQRSKTWRNGSGKNWSPNALACARSSCTKHLPLGAPIAANNMTNTRGGQRTARPIVSRALSFLIGRVTPCAPFLGRLLQLDRVTLHLIVERGTLDAEQFGCFFLVAPRFRQGLQNGLALQIIESLHAFARQPTQLGML